MLTESRRSNSLPLHTFANLKFVAVACVLIISGCQPELATISGIPITVAGQLHDAAAGDRLRVTLDPIVFVGRESPRKHVHAPREWPDAADLKIVNLLSSCGCLSAEAADGRAIDFAVHLSTTAGLVDKDVHVYVELSNRTVIVLEQSIVSAPPILTLRSIDSFEVKSDKLPFGSCTGTKSRT